MEKRERTVTVSVTFTSKELQIIQKQADEAGRPLETHLVGCVKFGSIVIQQMLSGKSPFFHDYATGKNITLEEVLDERNADEEASSKIVDITDYLHK